MTETAGPLASLLQDTRIPANPASTSLDDLDTPTSDNWYGPSVPRPHQNRPGAPQPMSKRPIPSLPDLRFEQSYLNSVSAAEGVWWRIALITARDQVLLPLLQGVGYNLFVLGWRGWNARARFGGRGVGAKVRRWWWDVNGWEIPIERW